jgi:hypothetical protein
MNTSGSRGLAFALVDLGAGAADHNDLGIAVDAPYDLRPLPGDRVLFHALVVVRATYRNKDGALDALVQGGGELMITSSTVAVAIGAGSSCFGEISAEAGRVLVASFPIPSVEYVSVRRERARLGRRRDLDVAIVPAGESGSLFVESLEAMHIGGEFKGVTESQLTRLAADKGWTGAGEFLARRIMKALAEARPETDISFAMAPVEVDEDLVWTLTSP